MKGRAMVRCGRAAAGELTELGRNRLTCPRCGSRFKGGACKIVKAKAPERARGWNYVQQELFPELVRGK